MTVKDLKAELEYYDDDSEVVFEIDDEVEIKSLTIDRYGFETIRIDSKLKEDFICDIAGDMVITLVTRKE